MEYGANYQQKAVTIRNVPAIHWQWEINIKKPPIWGELLSCPNPKMVVIHFGSPVRMIQSEFAGCNAVRFFPKQLVVAELDQDSPQPKCFLVSPPGCSTRSRFALEHSLINLAVASEVGSGDTKLDAIQFMIMARV